MFNYLKKKLFEIICLFKTKKFKFRHSETKNQKEKQ